MGIESGLGIVRQAGSAERETTDVSAVRMQRREKAEDDDDGGGGGGMGRKVEKRWRERSKILSLEGLSSSREKRGRRWAGHGAGHNSTERQAEPHVQGQQPQHQQQPDAHTHSAAAKGHFGSVNNARMYSINHPVGRSGQEQTQTHPSQSHCCGADAKAVTTKERPCLRPCLSSQLEI